MIESFDDHQNIFITVYCFRRAIRLIRCIIILFVTRQVTWERETINFFFSDKKFLHVVHLVCGRQVVRNNVVT